MLSKIEIKAEIKHARVRAKKISSGGELLRKESEKFENTTDTGNKPITESKQSLTNTDLNLSPASEKKALIYARITCILKASASALPPYLFYIRYLFRVYPQALL